ARASALDPRPADPHARPGRAVSCRGGAAAAAHARTRRAAIQLHAARAVRPAALQAGRDRRVAPADRSNARLLDCSRRTRPCAERTGGAIGAAPIQCWRSCMSWLRRNILASAAAIAAGGGTSLHRVAAQTSAAGSERTPVTTLQGASLPFELKDGVK